MSAKFTSTIASPIGKGFLILLKKDPNTDTYSETHQRKISKQVTQLQTEK